MSLLIEINQQDQTFFKISDCREYDGRIKKIAFLFVPTFKKVTLPIETSMEQITLTVVEKGFLNLVKLLKMDLFAFLRLTEI